MLRSAFVLLLFGQVLFSQTPAPSPSLTPADMAIIDEVYHLQREAATSIWPGWVADDAPFLYKTAQWDFLLNHPKPPARYKAVFDSLYGDTLYMAGNSDSLSYRAAYPVNGHFTVVMTAPGKDDDPCRWAIKGVHELFHVYQNKVRPQRIVNPFIGPHADKHELSYPFPYDDGIISSYMRLEAEHIFDAIHNGENDQKIKKLHAHFQKVAGRVFSDSLDWRFKQWMEWNEGVARYTERETARIAADSALYRPKDRFMQYYADANYAKTWHGDYRNDLNPIRFVGEGVRGRIQFYYLGMGKAYLLDLFDPAWRKDYFKFSIDALLTR